MAKKKEELDGVWRTIGGRRVFIRNGQSLSDAMKESGKFKKASDVKREEYQELNDKIERTNNFNKATKYISKGDMHNATPYMNAYLEYEDRITDRKKQEEYSGDISNLEGKHIAGKEKTQSNTFQDMIREEISKPVEYDYKSVNARELTEDINKREETLNELIDKNIKRNNENWEKGVSYEEYSLDKAIEKKTNGKYKSYDEMMSKVNEKTGNEAEKYYSKLSQYQAREDLDMRKSWLDDNAYAPDKRKEYEDFYKQGEEYYQKKYGNKAEYNSKAYAKELSQIYNAESEYDDKITPKYIQDIDAGRYGNMSDEQAIKNWIDGGADVIYNDDAEKILKNWNIPVKNDDAYGTYKNELTKQLLPIYKRDKQKVSLNKLPMGDLKEMAQDYKINTKGLSRQELIEKLLAIYNK